MDKVRCNFVKVFMNSYIVLLKTYNTLKCDIVVLCKDRNNSSSNHKYTRKTITQYKDYISTTL